jgi:hypothetical protein
LGIFSGTGDRNKIFVFFGMLEIFTTSGCMIFSIFGRVLRAKVIKIGLLDEP